MLMSTVSRARTRTITLSLFTVPIQTPQALYHTPSKKKKNKRKRHILTQPTDINKDSSFCNIFSLAQKNGGKAKRTLERRQTRFTFHHCVFTLSITVYLRRVCSAGEFINWLEYHIYVCVRRVSY